MNNLVTCGMGKHQSLVVRGFNSFIDVIVAVIDAIRFRIRGQSGTKRRARGLDNLVIVEAHMIEANGQVQYLKGSSKIIEKPGRRRVTVENLGNRVQRVVNVIVERLR